MDFNLLLKKALQPFSPVLVLVYPEYFISIGLTISANNFSVCQIGRHAEGDQQSPLPEVCKCT